ncbi:tol-pal system YbgF family protein, partial [candidate division KSB1 bacterium]
GMPNARNIPVSSLHTNIWYHLGLAYYLENNMEKALYAYRECRKASGNPDNVVSSSHWLYMILRRLGRETEANEILEPITKDMDVIENMAYHNLLLFYKGEMTLETLTGGSMEASSNAAVDYGIGNWYYYNGNVDEAKRIYSLILEGTSWASFGYIAAEADMSRMK